MKLLICADFEGVTGVVSWDHVTFGKEGYQRFRKLMTADINAAIAGAMKAGVDDIVVSDGHDTKTNVLIEEIDPRARLNSGSPSPYMMVQGVEENVDLAFFIGHHPRVGTKDALLPHTLSARVVADIWLNDRPVGEIGLYAAVCGHFGVPVVLLSGELAACREAEDWIAGIETVAVKKASGYQAAECLPPAVTHPMIREAAERAVEKYKAGKAPAPLMIPPPVRIRVQFARPSMAEDACMLPGAVRLSGCEVEVSCSDIVKAYHALRTMVGLAG